MIGRGLIGVALGLAATAAQAEMAVNTVRYGCERGAEIPASYINAGDDAAVVITVEGRQIALLISQSASGARYEWPSDGSGYVWWTKGGEAMLLWRDAKGEEQVLHAQCKALN